MDSGNIYFFIYSASEIDELWCPPAQVFLTTHIIISLTYFIIAPFHFQWTLLTPILVFFSIRLNLLLHLLIKMSVFTEVYLANKVVLF